MWHSSSIPNKQGRSTFFIASLSTWMDPSLLEEILKSIYSPVSPSPAPPWDWGPLTNSIFPRFPSQIMATSFFWFLRPKSLKVSSDPFFLTHQIQPISIPCGLYIENGFRIQTTLATSPVTSLTYLESLEQMNRSGNPTLLHSLSHVLCSKAVHLDKGHPSRFAPRCPVDRQLPRMLAHVTHLLKTLSLRRKSKSHNNGCVWPGPATSVTSSPFTLVTLVFSIDLRYTTQGPALGPLHFLSPLLKVPKMAHFPVHPSRHLMFHLWNAPSSLPSIAVPPSAVGWKDVFKF